MEVVISSILISMILVLNVLYLYFKTSKALLVFQQGGYSYQRLLTYIKENYKYTLGINELMPIVCILLCWYNPNYILLSLILIFFFGYYNLFFYNLNAKRYDKKLSLKLTWRVKRLLGTLLIIFILPIILILGVFKFSLLSLDTYYLLFIYLHVFIYLIFFMLMLANLINAPIEHFIKYRFKQKARKKLANIPNLKVVGVTGSYGKTSTKNIIFDLVKDSLPSLTTPASFNTPMGLCMSIDQDLSNLHRIFIAEMGAYRPGEIKELAKLVSPTIGVVTSVGPQHLETFKTVDNITKTKLELVENLPADGVAILNYDNEYIRKYPIKNKVKVKTYGIEYKDGDISATNITYHPGSMTFTLIFKGKEYPVTTRLLGRNNIENILAGVLVADCLGIEIEQIIERISRLTPVPNRLELKTINAETIIINDAFNANEIGIKESIKILGSYNDYRRILITPGLIDLGSKSKEIHYQLGKYLTKYCDDVLLVGDYNYEKILKGIKDTDYDLNKVSKYDNFLIAYNFAMRLPGKKVILIANDLPDKFNN